MQIEQLIAANTAALEANTAALNSLIAASGPTTTTTITIPVTETPKRSAGRPPKTTATPEPETETPTKVSAPAPESTEFNDPLDPETTVVPGTGTPTPKINVEAVISECIDTFKNMMLTADADRKNDLKLAFPKLREKWGLKHDDKLVVLSNQPEKLVGLLADIKNL